MTKSYEFNWQKHIPDFLQEGAVFDRFDEVVHTQTHTLTHTRLRTHTHTHTHTHSLTRTHTQILIRGILGNSAVGVDSSAVC